MSAPRRAPLLRAVTSGRASADDALLATLWGEDHEDPTDGAGGDGGDGAPQSHGAATRECDERCAAETGAEAGSPRRPALGDEDLVALVERIVDRDEHALAVLYDATSGRVHGLVLRIVRRSALAEEVVEDTFWQVWRQAPRYDAGRGRVLTWLLAMARSRAIDALRRDERYLHSALPADGELLDDDVGDPPMHEALAVSRGAERIHQALSALEPRTRQLVAMAFFRGLTHEEIAAQMAMPLGTVKSLIRRALQQLRRVLELAGPC